MSEEKVASNTHTMVQRLEDLRIEHMSLINSPDSPKTEQSDIILKNIKCIDVGLDEAQLMMEFSLHLQNVEIEKRKLAAQIKQLSEENDNLRDKLAESQTKLQIFEKIIGAAAVDVEKNLEWTMCMPQTNDEQCLETLLDGSLIELDDFVDYESDTTLTPRENQTILVDTEESVAFSHFRALQRLAIDYDPDGKYEMAFPLCQLAIDDLKKISVGRYHPYITKMMSIVCQVYGTQNKYKEAANLLHASIQEKTKPSLTFKC